MVEQTLVLIKPDGVQKNLSGKIISRFESAGLKIKALKLIQPTLELSKKHYPLDESWAKSVYEKTKSVYDKLGKPMEFNNYLDHGKSIQSRLQSFLLEGPVTAIVLEGENAITKVRNLVGHTEPLQAEKGTIRADFAPEESYEKADTEKRAVRNLVHASDAPETAKREIEIWFSQKEII
ncbi:MAG: nucleoside-diphosphate kinase [Candidatus Pacearchaeota archaeon]|nr:nucleoside-diphosphate kinase [Candidatus Pacearchaeota archaeon]